MKSRRLKVACLDIQTVHKKDCRINGGYLKTLIMDPCDHPCDHVLESFLSMDGKYKVVG